MDYTRQFSQLILDALRDPVTADKNALLTAGSAFLDAFRDGDDERAPLARSMAFKAMDWAVFECPEYYDQLKLAARAFTIACSIKRTADKVGT